MEHEFGSILEFQITPKWSDYGADANWKVGLVVTRKEAAVAVPVPQGAIIAQTIERDEGEAGTAEH